MSTAFTEFLREQAAKQAAEAERGKVIVDEWRAAIERLFDRIRGWLAQSDPDHIIQIEERQHEMDEEGLGRYRVPRLDLRAFGKWIGIIPKARNTVGAARPPLRSVPERAAGRVDITDEVYRYILYRFRKEGAEDDWVIDDLRSAQKPLDQPGFEEILTRFLR